MIKRISGLVLLLAVISARAGAQSSGVPLKNADIVQMMKSGLESHTIVLLIKQGPCDFDTSAQALIKLKKAGVSEPVIDAMITSTGSALTPVDAPMSGETLLEKALDAFGPRGELAEIHAVRWSGHVVETVNGEQTTPFEEERTEVFPDHLSLTIRPYVGPDAKLVVAPEYGYQSVDNLTRAIGSASAESFRQEVRFEPAYIAQHAGDYSLTPLGSEERGGVPVEVLKIALGTAEYVWRIDAQTGLLLSVQCQMGSGELITREYTDYRPVGGVQLPFKWRTTEDGRTTETTIKQYEINPAVGSGVFQRPENLSGGGALSLKVVDSRSVEYAQELLGNKSAACQLSQARNTSVVDPLSDIHFEKGTAPSNLKMDCNSWDTTKLFPRKLNAMLVVASDGNAYLLTCDQGAVLSKCFPLTAGRVFRAMHTDTGIAVLGRNAKGKEQEVNYSIVQAESLP